MIQTTLFNYFHYNGAIQPTVKKLPSFKQTNLTEYYNLNRIPKKNSILDYFKPKNNVKENEKKKEKIEGKVFDLVLVDIKESCDIFKKMKCVKKNMYDSDLKYIAISYRWGELNEQQLETPDYTAHITSFDLVDFCLLCEYISNEPDLKDIKYLWIDAISVDQQNKKGKKKTILKMNQIYKKAAYIVAVPDLHKEYLLKNTANEEIMNLIEEKYKNIIYKEIFNSEHSPTDNSINDDIKSSITINSIQQQQQHHINNNQHSFIQKLTNRRLIKKNNELKKENEELKRENEEIKVEMKENEMQQKKQEIKKVYQFLAYLIEDWSNRAWVISEYHIAKQKYMKHGTPLKYWFISLLYDLDSPFFSYHFNDDDDQQPLQQCTINNKNDDNNKNVLTYHEVIDPKTFHQFVKSKFMQRSHLEMILNSNATRNEDRFNAILPSWNEYKHLIKNVSKWNITNMTSVRLKLYEIMNDDDLWDKAKLLHACSSNVNNYILPSFASQYNMSQLMVTDKYKYNNFTYKEFKDKLLKYIDYKYEEKATQIKQLMNKYETNSKAIWTENLASIQFDQHRCCLSVKSKMYFIRKDVYSLNYLKYKLSLCDDDEVQYVFMPFFTFNLPGYIDDPKICKCSSSIYLIGNRDKNKWMLFLGKSYEYKSEHFCSDDYTFNIY
ncbi:unnamed protein product [Cunninghamella blakesleeana]